MGYNFEIMTDSTANLPEDMIEAYKLHVLSLAFIVDEVEYKGYEKGKTVDLNQFYEMMRLKKEITTSLANSQDAYEMAKPLLEEGRDILYIGFSSNLSSTFQAVSVALTELQQEYPDRKILCIDSLSAALGEGLFVKYLVDLREEGKPITSVYEWGMANRLHVVHAFTVDDLYFLKRGGRVSAAAAVIGTALSVKPVLHVDDEGRLIPLTNVRGRKKSLDGLVKMFFEKAIKPEEQTVFISHGDCITDAHYVATRIKEQFENVEIMIRTLDPVIGAHSGPGTVALFFYGNQR